MLYSHGNHATLKEKIMSIFKSLAAIVDVHAANSKEAKRIAAEKRAADKNYECVDQYDKTLMSYYTKVSDVRVHIRKQPLGFAEVTMTHDKGVEVSRMVRTPRQYVNIYAAYTNGVYAEAIRELQNEIGLYVQKEITMID